MKCPKCEEKITYVINEDHFSGKPKKRTIHWPIKDDNGKLIWKNLFHVDIFILLIIVGILLLLIGFRQINEQCYELLEEPCVVCDNYECTGQFAAESQQYTIPNFKENPKVSEGTG
jgi:hypothetical protein